MSHGESTSTLHATPKMPKKKMLLRPNNTQPLITSKMERKTEIVAMDAAKVEVAMDATSTFAASIATISVFRSIFDVISGCVLFGRNNIFFFGIFGVACSVDVDSP